MKILFDTATQSFQPYPRYDDAEVVGLDPRYIIYTVNQEERPAYDPATQHLEVTETANHDTRVLTRSWSVVNNLIAVSMRTLRFALFEAGLLQPLIDTMAAITDPAQKLYAENWWATAGTVERNHPLVAILAAALNQSDEQVDAIFASARLKDA